MGNTYHSPSLEKPPMLWSILLCVVLSLPAMCASAQDTLTITYSDTYSPTAVQPVKIPAVSKAKRTNRDAISFVIIGEENLDENMSKALNYAVSVWQGAIRNNGIIVIEVKTENIEESIRTKVQYKVKNSEYTPLSLINYPLLPDKRPFDFPDGIITINSNMEWDYAIGENISENGNNLAYGLMRAIARILGFGSSIKVYDTGEFVFGCQKGHSIFEKRIVNSNGVALSSISPNRGKPSAALTNYVTAENTEFYLNTSDEQFKLAPPPYSHDRLPFIFLDDPNSLMGDRVSAGSYVLDVDNATQAILNDLGWDIKATPSIKIISDDVPDTGIASSYQEHNFRIENSESSLQSPTWAYRLPLADGSFKTINLPDNGLSCVTPAVDNPALYRINQDGDIEASLQFSCTVNGRKVQSAPFRLTLELKPFIEYAEITDIVDNSPYASYNVHYRVKYRGADKIKVSVEEEYSSKLKSCYIREPYIATGVADHITSPYYAWLDFSAENKYGKSVYTIELEPRGASWNKSHSVSESTAGRHATAADVQHDNERFEVYDVNGINLGTVTDLADIDRNSRKGLLIIKHLRDGITVRTFKLIN